MAKTSEWLKQNEDGSVDITLSKPATINGAQVSFLRMREPTVADQLAAKSAGADAKDVELAMFANLMETTPADLHRLKLRDYSRLQAAFMGFID